MEEDSLYLLQFELLCSKKDQCLVYSNYYKAHENDKATLKTEFKEHIARKECCNSEKAKDKERAEKGFCCVTFDLLYFRFPLDWWDICIIVENYVFAISEAAASNDAYRFAWSELNGKRGSSEIGIILNYYLSTCVSPHVNEVYLYSDTCGGENRSQNVAALLLFAVQNIPHIKK